MNTFSGQTIIVTGGAKGIGKAIVQAFAVKGGKVVIADRDETDGKVLEQELSQNGHKVSFILTDVQKEEDVTSLMNHAVKHYGQIDILINNAGISKFHSFFDMTVEIWDEIINTNLRSVFLCSREASKRMDSGGSIVNIASTRAFMSEPNTEAYSASKGGIAAITHALATTLSERKIRVNSISPGWIENEHYDELRKIDHEQHLSGRVGKPEDIARCCLFLCNPENDFITGENIMIDGGMTRKMIYEH